MEIFLLCLGFIALPFVGWGLFELFKAYIAPAKKREAVLRKKDSIVQESFSGKKSKKLRLFFETEDRRLVFSVSREQFAILRQGSRGELTYRGRRFISFK